MSRATYASLTQRWGARMGDAKMIDMMVGALTDPFDTMHMGVTAENVAAKCGLTREVQDAFAVESHKRAAAAIAAGHFKSQILPIELKSRKGTVVFDTDEHVRADASVEGMAKLKAVFIKENGTVTAGNASGINDAAAAVVLMEKSAAAAKGLKPMARLLAYGHAGIDPKIMGLGPVSAVQRALAKAGIKLADIDVIESNEAFAAQALGVSKELGFDAEEGQPQRRRGRARASDRRHRRDPHRQGDVRAAPHRRALRPHHHVHRRRPGHRGDYRARLTGVSLRKKPRDRGAFSLPLPRPARSRRSPARADSRRLAPRASCYGAFNRRSQAEDSMRAGPLRNHRSASWLACVGMMLASLLPVAPIDAQSLPESPNILFIVLDDVGIDQMKAFGYGGATPPRTPNIDTIASSGLRFRNFWAMPECSPSRALMFEGRYPMRTNVLDAILSVDLANSQVSPYETTIPRVLRMRGYQSGLFGKFHLTGSDVDPANNPLGYTAVHQLGWDYFAGWQDGAPHPIDATAGGVAPAGASYTCGFVPNAADDPVNGADAGACYLADQSCSQIVIGPQSPTPGRTCLERGGIFDPRTACASPPPAFVDFTLQNGYYAGQLIINRPDGSYSVLAPQDPSGAGRGYRSIIESNSAIGWINTRPVGTPWMASLTYSSAHTPYQQPPTSLLPAVSAPTGAFDCATSEGDQRILSNQMIEAMDAEIGRVLVETGVATRRPDGSLDYDPFRTNTMLVIMGDNGTYAPVVKAPFNPLRSKATVYQTGVWVPLIIAGPLVSGAGEQVDAMVNIADLFQLFGDFAGIDVHDVVPKSRPIDSVAMLPYLRNSHLPSLRKTNFTQTATNLKAAGYVVPPCVIASANSCVQLFPTQELCQSEGGVWWGTGGSGPGAPQQDCCGVNKYQSALSPPAPYSVLPNWQMAMRNDDYKLVRLSTTDYDATSNSCVTTVANEFYSVDQNVPPRLDNSERNLLSPTHRLSRAERVSLVYLTHTLDELLATNVPCTGDGNLDGVVDLKDVDQFNYWANVTDMNSSWYDLNLDGLTNQADVPYITGGMFPRLCQSAGQG